MRLYHFCADRHVNRIRHEGLRLGGVSVVRGRKIRIYEGYNWLTLDGEKKNQSWNTHNLVKYDRTAWRLTVEIPDEEADRILDQDALEEKIPGTKVLFIGWPGSENWRVYQGFIPPGWIKEAVRMDG